MSKSKSGKTGNMVKTVHVNGYTTKSGAKVPSHRRSTPNK